MSADQNKAIARRVLEDLFSTGNLAVADELAAPDIVFHSFTQPEPIRGREGVKRFVTRLRTGFPDFRITVEDLIAEGDKVVARWTSRQTFKGTYLSIPPTGRPAQGTGIDIFRIANGQVVEVWLLMDGLGMMQQLGVIPRLEQLPRPVVWLMGRLQRLGHGRSTPRRGPYDL